MITTSRSEGGALQRLQQRYAWLRSTVVTNFFLGFSGGLPLPLVYATLTVWLEEAGVERKLISTFAWIGFAYALKFLWAPLIDSARLPFLTEWLGRRRAWLFLSQCSVAICLLVLSTMNPAANIALFAIVVLATALMAATQDVVIDAYRVESDETDMQGLLAAAYQYGYRVALIFSGAFALYVAEWSDWAMTYKVMALLMGVGVATVLLSPEPQSITRPRTASWKEWIVESVVKPFLEFFRRVGWVAAPILLYILFFRTSDYVLGILANPFYIDLGFSKSDVASVAKVYGLVVALVGVAAGGVAMLRWGIYRSLIVASLLIAGTNLFFAFLAFQGPQLWALAVTISGDNFAQGFAGTALIAYLSSLTNVTFTATQYALFSSLSVISGKFVAGFSGRVQTWDGWPAVFEGFMTSPARDADWAGWIGFFLYAAVCGVPSIVLALVVAHPSMRPKAPLPPSAETTVKDG
ncbi:MAG: MFS transporter [Pseudomonadota bacterium]